MTRIFDALRKSQAAREPAVLPSSTPVLQPVRPLPAPGHAPIERLETAPLGAVATLDDEVLREMATLRVSLEGALPHHAPRGVMFVSAQRGDGTSTVALQFAQFLSREPGLRVLLVDANRRRESELVEAARAAGAAGNGRSGFDLLPLGDRMRRTEAMPVAEFRGLLEMAGAPYDWMIVDGAPLIESPESAPLAAQLGGVVLVLRAGRSKRPILGRALDLLKRANANVLGTVLNARRLEIPDFIYRRM